MPTYLTPGTYVEGVPRISGAPVEGAATSVAAFVGLAPGGPTDTPVRVTSWNQFQGTFGDPAQPGNGPFADGAYLAHAVFGFFANGGQVCWVVRVEDDLVGDPARRTGLEALAAVDELTMVCVPDVAVHAQGDDPYAFERIQGTAIALCEAAGDRIAILDAAPALLPQEVLEWRRDRGGYDSHHAALYWPWITVVDPLSARPLRVPPCGHVAGAWARSDVRRGIHKAPANEVLLGAQDLEYAVTAAEQGALNAVGVNCLRAFPARGIRIWGARTLSSDPEWRYINHRRLVAFVSRSLSDGIRWATFEPNDPALWVQLRVAAASFLTRLWRDGALLGATPEEAFFVRCDETLNPPEQVEQGQVIIEVGIALVRPAEFVVFRLAQTGADPSEVAAPW
jgi:phage tail sheath protein FI